jgi:pyridoxamine--pyruvate transaminase
VNRLRYAPGDAPLFTLATGPVDAYPAVLRALGSPVPYDYDPSFQATYQRVAEKLHAVVKAETVPVILQGEPVLALEAAAASLIARDDVVLNLVSGVYGKGFEGWAARGGARVLELAVPYDRVIAAEAVAAMLHQHPDVTVVAACHHDTPSGTINPVDEIGAVVARHGALFLVDAVSSFGGMDVDPAACCADVFVTSPGKCLGGAPGLTPVAVSEAGWAKVEANPTAPRGSVLSLLDWRHAWRAGEAFPFTPSVAEIHGLDAALDLYLDEGSAQVWARHAATARACRAGVRAMGLSIWPAADAIASPTSTVVRLPAGVDAAAVLRGARETMGVVFAPGRGAMQPGVVRIGHMGVTAEPPYAAFALTALAAGLRRAGVACDVGRGLAAAWDSLD